MTSPKGQLTALMLGLQHGREDAASVAGMNRAANAGHLQAMFDIDEHAKARLSVLDAFLVDLLDLGAKAAAEDDFFLIDLSLFPSIKAVRRSDLVLRLHYLHGRYNPGRNSRLGFQAGKRIQKISLLSMQVQ